MAVSYTTDNLVARIRRATQLSERNLKLSQDEVLQIADEAIQSVLWPTLRSSIEEYAFAAYYAAMAPLELNPTGAPGTFRLPPRASGSTVGAIFQMYPNEGSTSGRRGLRLITRVDIADLSRMAGDDSNGWGTTDSDQPLYYALSGDFVHLWPRAREVVYLKVLYERRPSRLVFPEACAYIDAFSPATPEETTVDLTVDSMPDGWIVGMAFDLVKSQMQATDPIADSMTSTLLSPPTSMQLQAQVPPPGGLIQQISVGDYVCPEGETCVFPLPDVWYSICIQRAAADVLQQCGYVAEGDAMEAKIQSRIDLALNLSTNRARKQPKPIFDQQSPLRRIWPAGGWGNGWGSW